MSDLCGYPVRDCALGVYITECENRIEELEAKLAKAVEALFVIEGWSNKPAIVVSKTRTTLAELTGGKDE